MKLGSIDITKGYLGSTEITKAYLGSTLVLDNSSSYILDTYPATSAFSFRKLSSTATNCCIVTNTAAEERTVILESTGLVSLSSLLVEGGTLGSWAGSDNIDVKTMFDQSGNGNDFTNTDKSQQPRLITTGILNVNSSGNIAFNVSDGADKLISSFTKTSNQTIFSVLETSDTKGIFFYDGVAPFFAITQQGNAGTIDSGSGTPSYYINSASFSGTRDDFYNVFSTGLPLNLSVTNVDLSAWAGFQIAGYPNFNFGHNLSELIIYNTDQSANRVAIETELNTTYNLY